MKRRAFAISLLVVILAVGALVVVSCKKTTGGGWIPVYYDWSTGGFSTEPLGKATFGFQMRCRTVNGGAVLTGEFQYNDHYNNIKFHGIGYGSDQDYTCEEIDEEAAQEGYENYFVFGGTYRPQPKGEEGEFNGYVIDNGEPGILDTADYIEIELINGEYDGYVIQGDLGAGNIQVHTE